MPECLDTATFYGFRKACPARLPKIGKSGPRKIVIYMITSNIQNGMPTANTTSASDARGSQFKCESGASDPASRAQVLPGPAATGALHPAEYSGGALGRPVIGHYQEKPLNVAFLFPDWFSRCDPSYNPSVTSLFLLLERGLPNSTCSRAVYLCIIGFAYRAAVARVHMGVRLAAILESQ
jgi:hypothetical protein